MFKTLITLFIGAVFLSACGGGSSGSSPTPVPTPVPPPTPNQAPTVSTSNLTVDEGEQVVLSATVSDADGTISTYRWTQSSGETVSLEGGDTANASFTAPQSNAQQELAFSLQVTDNDGASASSTLTVTINDLDVGGTLIGAGGGSVISDDGELTLLIPANALASDTMINIRRRNNSEVPQDHIPEDIAVASHYQFSPEGLEFATPAIVTQPYTLHNNESGKMPLTWLVSGRGEGDDTEYELLRNIVVDIANETISGEMLHFSSLTQITEVGRLVGVDIVDVSESGAFDIVGGDDRFLVEYALQLDTNNLASALETTNLRGLNKITFGENLSIRPSLSINGVVHDTVAEPIIFDQITNSVLVNSPGEISGQCVNENPRAYVSISDELIVFYSDAGNSVFESHRLGQLLSEDSTYSIFISERIGVDCIERQAPIPPTEPFFFLLEGALLSLEGMAIIDDLSIAFGNFVSAVCPQILVAGKGGTVLTNACTGELLNSFVNEQISDQDNFQTAVLVAPQGEPEQINFIQNQRMRQLDVESLELLDFAMLLDFSFSNPQVFLDITNLGGDKTKGAAYVAGSSFIGILSYSFEFSGFSPNRFIIPDIAKSIVANAEGTRALIVNSNNQLIFYDLSGEQAQRTFVDDLGEDVRRLRCNFETNVCSAADFSLNLLKTFIWDGQSAPNGIVDTETVADGPVEMSMKDNKIAVAGFRDDKLSVVTVSSTGEIISSETLDLPARCQGPGHVEIIEGAVIVSCNLSNNLLYLPIID